MKKSEQFLSLAIFILYAGLGLVLLYYHEPWRDEAQAWLLARDLSVFELKLQMPYEGTPMLWHLLIMPFAKFNFPYWSMRVLHYIIALFIVYLFLYKSPFPIWLKTLYVFSFLMLFDYCVVARNYNISLLLLFILAILWETRTKYPLRCLVVVALLFNTNVHSFGLAFAIMAVCVWEIYRSDTPRRKKAFLISVPILGMLLLFYQIIGASDNMHYGLFQYSFLGAPIVTLIGGFTSLYTLPSFVNVFVLALILMMLSVFFFDLYREKNLAVLFIFVFSYIWLFYVFSFKYLGGFRHHVFFLNTLIFCLWIAGKNLEKWNKDVVLFLLAFFLLLSVARAGVTYTQEVVLPFSCSREVANFIKRNEMENEIIVAYHSSWGSSVLPYFSDLEFWYPDVEDFGTFVTWNETYAANQDLDIGEILTRAEKVHARYFLFDWEVPYRIARQYHLRLIFQSDPSFGYGNENYYFYQLDG